MKTKLLAVFAFIFSLMTADLAYAVSTTGHASPGGSGIRPMTFPTMPSFVYRVCMTYQEGLAMRDDNGRIQRGTEPFKANGISLGHKFVWTPDMDRISWLGNAQYHTHLIVPTTFAQMSAGGSRFQHSTGFGDPSFFPLDLSWDYEHLQLTYSLGGFLPIGDYDKGNPTSLGRGFWSLVNIIGINWYPDEQKEWCLSLLTRYEKHYTQKDTDFRNGDDLSFEWSISKKLAKNWELGLVGYDWIQVRDDKGVDLAGRSADLYRKDQVHAAGLELEYTNYEHAFSIGLRGLRDWKAEGRLESWSISTTFTFLFM